MEPDQPGDDARLVPDDPRLLTRLTEYTDDALWLFTPDWASLVFINSAYEEIFGQPVATIREDPTSFVDAVHPDDRPEVQEAMAVLSDGTPVDLEFRVDPDDDYDTWVWVQGQPVYDDDGEMEYVAGYTREITERKKYEQTLEQYQTDLERSNESLRQFAYIASHDLQEPLRMVSSYVDLLDAEYGDQFDEEAGEYMEFAVNGARRMQQMIDSLLAYSRVHTEAGEFEEIDAGEVFEDTRQDLELLIAEHDAEVSVGDLPTVEADPDQLGQVFQNLVKNAIEHADEGSRPHVEVTATEREDVHEFAVADDGPGIPEDEQDDVFDIFRQGTSASSTDNTGIGLAITERIVQRHGGRIRVDSAAGEGATFTFTVPKASSPATGEIERV